MPARVGVVVFPGTNCEHDVAAALRGLGAEVELVWHTSARLDGDLDAVVIPGGFAHGDYLRPGALARFSPVMAAVSDLAASGRPVVGICNGFQVLCEAGLLPGALQRNHGLEFLCRTVGVVVASERSALTAGLGLGRRLQLPINHFTGAYTCDAATLAALIDRGQVVLRYEDNPNGSLADIAGVANESGNVVGLMPHPERACDPLLGSSDGRLLLAALLDRCLARGAAAGPA